MNVDKSITTNSINIYKQSLNKTYNSEKKIIIKKDTIEISKKAKEISKQLVKNNDNLRYEKVISIKKSIQDGTYTINHRELAKKMIDKMKGKL